MENIKESFHLVNLEALHLRFLSDARIKKLQGEIVKIHTHAIPQGIIVSNNQPKFFYDENIEKFITHLQSEITNIIETDYSLLNINSKDLNK